MSSAPLTFASFEPGLKAVVVGATGGIGKALVVDLERSPSIDTVFQLSRSPSTMSDHDLAIDLADEASIENSARTIKQSVNDLDLVIVASGILHDGDGLQPEKAWSSITPEALERAMRINAVGPALIAKHFLPLLARHRKTVFAAISARVGSIEDNGMGGWYAYRASKAALNMLIKSFAIELARRRPDALCIGMHPGTVDTNLSQPFQGNVSPGKLFTPAQSARYMLTVIDQMTSQDSGNLFAWDGSRIPF